MKTLLPILFYCCFLVPLGGQATHSEHQFSSGDVTLGGSLFLPPSTDSLRFLFILVPDEGKRDRSFYTPVAEQFVLPSAGLFIFDRRGTGTSQGKFKTLKPGNSDLILGELAADVVNAAAYLKTLPQTKSLSLGLLGLGQGAWATPLVAKHSEQIERVVIISGPTVTVGEKIAFGKEVDKRKKEGSVMEAVKQANHDFWQYSAPKGFDPLPYLKQMYCPSLWLFGEYDEQTPGDASIDRLGALMARLPRGLINIVILPDADHRLHSIHTGERLNYRYLIADWLKESR